MKTNPLPALAALVLFSGCASISVRDVQKEAAAQKPAVIYVADFDTRGGQWKTTSKSKSQAQIERETADLLAETLVANLNAHVGPARRAGAMRSAPAGSWLVTGRFIRVAEGSPAARLMIGLGAGGSKLETETLVLDPAAGGIVLRFGTTGGSNAMPGMLMSSGPSGAVSNLLQQANRGLRDDTKRTARMITASIGEFMVERGWLPAAKIKVKKPGQFQLLQTTQGTPKRGAAEARSR